MISGYGRLRPIAVRTGNLNKVHSGRQRTIFFRARSGPAVERGAGRHIVFPPKIWSKGADTVAAVASRGMVSRIDWIVAGLLWVALAPPPAAAQSNLDAGKTPAQIFSHTCNACHRSPRELKPTSSAYLRDHYTAGPREAAAMAAYLASIGSDPEAVKQRKPPVLGAGRDPPPPDATSRPAQIPPGANRDIPADNVLRPPGSIPVPDQARPPDAQAALPVTPNRSIQRGGQFRPPAQIRASAAAARPRRPSDSIEQAQPSLSQFTGTISASAEAPSIPLPREQFEE
jgi:hypothetical protein